MSDRSVKAICQTLLFLVVWSGVGYAIFVLKVSYAWAWFALILTCFIFS